ncbi:MAG: ABC transporter permease, partial [Balneolales bacterium]|nr:ABC transporter permease [Balneolales bacterium]
MFFNYLKIAFRNITRDKYYSMISFTGLTIGLSFFGLMLITLNHEFSYDSTYTDSERIYRTILVSSSNQVEDKNAQLPLPFSEVISSDIEGIEAISKVYAIPQQLVETHQKRGRMDDLVATDASFFKIFDLDLVAGNASTALENQMSIVLTKEIAQRFYGDEDPIGKTFDVEMYGLFTVTGVLDDLPKNSSFRFGGIMNASVERYLENFDGPDWFRAYYTSWNGRVAYTYVKLSDGANPEYISDQFESIAFNYFPGSSATRTFLLQPIHDVHFHSSDIRANISELNGTPGNVQYVYIFAALAILILSIACINYMNLSSARSIKRTSEVGLRSVFGAGKGQLIVQFLIQSILIASLCVLPSLVVLQLMFPYFETLTGIELSLTLGDFLAVGSYAIPSVLIIGAISGLYPAIVLSRFQLSQTVKQTVGSVQSSLFRKGLVIGQFALTYSIIVITLIAGRQLNFIFDKELGFTDEQVVVMEINDGRLRDFIPDLKQQVTNHPDVTGIAGMTRMISGYREPDIIEVTRDNMPDENLPFSFYGFDEDVLPVLDIELIQGRNFLSEGGETLNQTSVLINQSAAQILFENESPINQIIS